MSSTTKFNKNVSSTKKPYCKVCHDAGKEEAIYTSHYVKSDPGPKGKVVCPTLLQQLCKYCSKQGHTITYCPEVKKQEKMDKKMDKKNNYINTNNNFLPIPKLIKNNKFDLLQEQDNSDEEGENSKKSKSSTSTSTNNNKAKPKAKEEFPALSTSKTTLKAVSYFPVSYKEAANKGHEVAVKEEILTEIYVTKKKEQETKKPIILIEKKRKPILVEKKKNWADYSSSDDEDDEDDYGEYELYESKKPCETESIDFYEY